LVAPKRQHETTRAVLFFNVGRAVPSPPQSFTSSFAYLFDIATVARRAGSARPTSNGGALPHPKKYSLQTFTAVVKYCYDEKQFSRGKLQTVSAA
jgi:hypothetical protein